jgi:hypothetical protein
MWIASISAAVFLLYPSDSTHTYLSSLAVRASMFLAMSGLILILRTWMRDDFSATSYLSGLALIGLSALVYETSVFLLILLPLFLLIVGRQSRAIWWRAAATGYVLLAIFLSFRLNAALSFANNSAGFYSSIRMEPDWLLNQAKSIPAATFWRGWLYALSVALDFGLARSIIALLVLTVLILLSLGWLQRGSKQDSAQPDRVLGLISSVAAVAPIWISTLPLANTVGTFEGRLVAAAALGHALVLAGLLAWLGAFSSNIVKAVARTLPSALLAVALVGSFGVQQGFTRSWHSQLDIQHALKREVPWPSDNQAFVLLQVPAGPFDSRFYYPLTELVRRSYDNSTLHLLPWQQGYPPEEQLIAFGDERAIALVELVRKEVNAFDYDRMQAFRVGPLGELNEEQEIGTDYFISSGMNLTPIPFPEGWQPARERIQLQGVESAGLAKSAPTSDWQRMFSLHLALRAWLPISLTNQDT